MTKFCATKYLNLRICEGFICMLLSVQVRSTRFNLPLESFIFEKFEEMPLKQLLHLEISAREMCEKFVYKHSEKIEYVKS